MEGAKFYVCRSDRKVWFLMIFCSCSGSLMYLLLLLFPRTVFAYITRRIINMFMYRHRKIRVIIFRLLTDYWHAITQRWWAGWLFAATAVAMPMAVASRPYYWIIYIYHCIYSVQDINFDVHNLMWVRNTVTFHILFTFHSFAQIRIGNIACMVYEFVSVSYTHISISNNVQLN